MITNQGMVAQFMKKYGLSLDHRKVDTRFVRARLVVEELAELVIGMQENNRELVMDAVGDLMYVAYGAACLYDFNADEAFKRVHESNMTKGQDTGHGKLLKGPGWVPPDFSGL